MQLTYIVLIKRTPKNPEKVYSILFKWHKNDEPFSDVLSVHPWGQWAEKKTSPKQQQPSPPCSFEDSAKMFLCTPEYGYILEHWKKMGRPNTHIFVLSILSREFVIESLLLHPNQCDADVWNSCFVAQSRPGPECAKRELSDTACEVSQPPKTPRYLLQA